MSCQACGVDGPTRSVQFHSHTGMLIMMRHSHIGGNLCKRCINKYFSQYTGWTAMAGWWGMISVFVTPVVLLWNTGLWLSTLGLKDAGPPPPPVTPELVARLKPFTEHLFTRLQEDPSRAAEVAGEVAARAGVTPEQVMVYVAAVLRAAQKSQA